MLQRSPIALGASLLLVVTALAAAPAKDTGPDGIVSRIKRVAVESTAIDSIGYSKPLRALEIEFRNGAIYRYLEVERTVYRELMEAASKSRFYHENIRGKYRSVHVRRSAEGGGRASR